MLAKTVGTLAEKSLAEDLQKVLHKDLQKSFATLSNELTDELS